MSQILARGFKSAKVLASGFFGRIYSPTIPEVVKVHGFIEIETKISGIIDRELRVYGDLQ